jgi:DNA-binding response OmpR family regulator
MARARSGTPYRIAVVTLDPDIAQLEDDLREHGFVATGFRLPDSDDMLRETAAALRDARPHAVVYDVDPPSTVHVEMLHRLRALPWLHDLPALILTSEPEVVYELLGPAVVYEVVLEKPAHPHAVARALSVMLEERSAS